MSQPSPESHQEAPGGAPQPDPRPPLDWWRSRLPEAVPWPLACLAAALCGWDPHCEEAPEVMVEGWDAAVGAARSLLDKLRAAPPPAASPARIFILHHPDLMHAVVAYKPSIAETGAVLRSVREAEDVDLRAAAMTAAVWDRCLWPAQGSAELQALHDQLPGAVVNDYPMAYLRAIGVNTQDVRRKR